MNPFTPPTDNLYKFLAISGLVVVLFSAYFPYMLAAEFWSRAEVAIGDVLVAKAELDFLEQDIEAIGKKGTLTEQENEALEQRERDLARANASSHGRAIALQRLDEQYRFIYRAAIAGVLIGVAMMGLGFWLWYYRVQVYQDAVLVYDAEEKRRQARQATGSQTVDT